MFRWIGKLFGGNATVFKSRSMALATRQMLGGAFAGSWSTDHREETKHFTGWNYVAIHAIANQVAGAEVSAFLDESINGVSKRKAIRSRHQTLGRYKSIYGQEEKETQPLDHNHPLVHLLKHPNPYETGATFRYKQAIQIRLTGTCFVWNVPSKAGPACERYVIPTSQVTPVMPTVDMPLGGFRVSPYSSRYIPVEDQGFVEGGPTWSRVMGKIIDARQMQVIRLPHAYWFDDGQSPISAAAQWVDTEQGVNIARVGQLRNGADPSIFIELPPDVSPDQDEMDRITEKINKKYSGADNVGKVIIGLSGTKPTPLTQSAREMCYTEAFQDVKSSVLSLHQTPPVAVGCQEPGAYAAYFASMMAWRAGAIQPLCDMLAESDTKFLASQFGEGITVEIEAPAIDDKDQDEKTFNNNVAGRICTLNELRAMRGLPPHEGPEGDELWPPQQAKQAPQGEGQIPQTPMSKSYLAAIQAVNDVDRTWRDVRRMKSSFKAERWITIHPHGHEEHGVHIKIDDDGRITAGPKGITDRGITHVSDFGKHPDHDEAVEELKPHAHQFLLEQHREREAAKEHARKVTGLNAGNLAKYENTYHDYSNVRNFDTAARTVAEENPGLGLDPDGHDTPAKVWELIREGKKKKPTIDSLEVHDLATEWAKRSRHVVNQHFDHDDDWDNFKSMMRRWKGFNPDEPRDDQGRWTDADRREFRRNVVEERRQSLVGQLDAWRDWHEGDEMEPIHTELAATSRRYRTIENQMINAMDRSSYDGDDIDPAAEPYMAQLELMAVEEAKKRGIEIPSGLEKAIEYIKAKAKTIAKSLTKRTNGHSFAVVEAN